MSWLLDIFIVLSQCHTHNRLVTSWMRRETGLSMFLDWSPTLRRPGITVNPGSWWSSTQGTQQVMMMFEMNNQRIPKCRAIFCLALLLSCFSRIMSSKYSSHPQLPLLFVQVMLMFENKAAIYHNIFQREYKAISPGSITFQLFRHCWGLSAYTLLLVFC